MATPVRLVTARTFAAASVDHQVETNSERQAAEDGHNQDPDACTLAQLAQVKRELDLQPHDEEEQRYESFVYEPAQVVCREYVVVQAERQLCCLESLVGTRSGRVGPAERDERDSDEDHGTTGLYAQEVSNRGAEVTRPGRPAGLSAADERSIVTSLPGR